MIRPLIAFVFLVLLNWSCIDTQIDTEVIFDDINVGSICEFADELIFDDPDFAHFSGKCDGYAEWSDGSGCVPDCVDDLWCQDDYYCDVETSECIPRVTDGECTSTDECLLGLCLCNACIDPLALLELSLGGI